MNEVRLVQGGQRHHSHDHTHGMAGRSLRIAFFLTAFILAAEVIGGLLSNSLALLSDAGHVVTDLFALGLAWFAAVQAGRPSNERKTFGYHRVGILAALLNAATLILIAAAITWEAIQRFQHPEPVQPLMMFGVAAVGFIANLYVWFVLRREGDDNLNTRAALLHVFGDVGASAAVIVAGAIMLFSGWTIVDPLLSVAIALLIAFGGWRVLRETIDILLEAVPHGISLTNLVRDMKSVEGVKDVHDLHVWSITSGMYALSCHVMIDNLPPSASSPILQSLTQVLNEKYQIGHSTIQFECNTSQGGCCDMRNLYCQLERGKEPRCEHPHH
ncbi:MAG: cation transporter [Ktedonobacteraceae bacterium]|nr:cation transporter [Ktedonobacteraceae bacterium]